MPRRHPEPKKPAPTPAREPAKVDAAAGAAAVQPPRVLIVQPETAVRAALTSVLRDHQMTCDPVATADEALGAVVGATYDVVLIDQDMGVSDAPNLIRRVASEDANVAIIATASRPTLDHAVAAMRLGVVDLLSRSASEADLLASVTTAVERTRAARATQDRTERLKRICRRLNIARQRVTDQVDTLCNDLVGAYQELADQVTHVALASEFGSIIQQELDVESLLRTMLEYMLTKTGPTNAAVFLPSNHSDYSLGAYVNYDCPRDAADVLLDHLADVVAPRFEDEEGVVTFEGDEELDETFGADAHWLAGSRVIVFSARHEGECLAVVTLFRDRSSPFPEELTGQLAVLKDLFGRQLARIIRIHHRHHPDQEWSGWDTMDEDEDDWGMAA